MNINSFEIRSYGWQELAILYAPDLTPESAAKRLSTWVQINPTLLTALEAHPGKSASSSISSENPDG